jgi:hypothetical protein
MLLKYFERHRECVTEALITTTTPTYVTITGSGRGRNSGDYNEVAGSRKMPRATKNFIPIVIAGLVWHLCGYAQNKPKASSKVFGEDSNVSCYDESGKLVGPNKMRTFMLESPDRKYRGYAETEAVTHKRENAQGDEDVGCENKTGLFVAGPENQKFRASNECVAQALPLWQQHQPGRLVSGRAPAINRCRPVGVWL